MLLGEFDADRGVYCLQSTYPTHLQRKTTKSEPPPPFPLPLSHPRKRVRAVCLYSQCAITKGKGEQPYLGCAWRNPTQLHELCRCVIRVGSHQQASAVGLVTVGTLIFMQEIDTQVTGAGGYVSLPPPPSTLPLTPPASPPHPGDCDHTHLCLPTPPTAPPPPHPTFSTPTPLLCH